jgi:large subunit ribosomal protein L17
MQALLLTERDDAYYEGLLSPTGKPVNPPTHKGRIITTLQKAKEVKPMVDRLISIAKKAIPQQAAAEEWGTKAERNSQAWKQWRESDNYKKWVAAQAPVVNARRRAFAALRDKEAVQLLFEVVAPRYLDRPGGYTRVLRLATPRLGDNGTRAILEFVGKHERTVAKRAQAPVIADDSETADVS